MRWLRTCSVLFFVNPFWTLCAVSDTQQTWSVWFDTDSPTSGLPDDDESIDRIKLRGIDVCPNGYPVDVMCRDVKNQSVTFNARTRYLAVNYLLLPCTAKGLICRDVDQVNDTCRDYEVRFECKANSKQSLSQADGTVIIIAACLSVVCVLVPIGCITVVNLVRLRRHRRTRRNQHANASFEQSAQTDARDLPPSYAVLFGEGILGPQAVTLSRASGVSVTVSTADGDIDFSFPSPGHGSRRNSGGMLERIPENSTQSAISIESDQFHGLTITPSPSRRRRISSWRRRFPNLHLSIFEIFATPESSEPSSPSSMKSTFSYDCTPPPTYQEAVIMISNGKDNHLPVPGGNISHDSLRISEITSDGVIQELPGCSNPFFANIRVDVSGASCSRCTGTNDNEEPGVDNEGFLEEPEQYNTRL